MSIDFFSPDKIQICVIESLIPRSSSHFLVPLLDGHPELIVGFSQYFPDIDKRENFSSEKPEVIAKDVFSQWQQEIPDEYSLDCIPFSFEQWKEPFVEYLNKYGYSRKNIFIALHYAAAQAAGKDVSQIKWIIYHQHFFRYEKLIRDFPTNVKVILTTRDPRSAFWSCRKSVVKDQLLHFIFYTRLRANSCYYQFVPYEQFPVRHEDLHRDYALIRRKICNFLSIPDNIALDSATVFGHPWDGTHRDGTCESNFKIRSTTPDARFVNEEWRERLSRTDIFLINLLLRGFIRKYGYCLE